MAWTVEARKKALESRIAKGKMNQYYTGSDYVMPESTRIKLQIAGKSRTHSEETKKKISKSARASTHRRLVRTIVEYTCKDGNVVKLDSSWEVLLAKRLDEMNVEWVRPSQPLNWQDSRGNIRNYFPDFFLPQYNVYLDPKNPAAMKQQKEKVQWLKRNRSDVVFLTSLEEISAYVPVA